MRIPTPLALAVAALSAAAAGWFLLGASSGVEVNVNVASVHPDPNRNVGVDTPAPGNTNDTLVVDAFPTNSAVANANAAPPPPSPSLVHPMADFPNRITKKHFGQYITKANSPVQPERFSGYHAGSDAEATPEEADIDVPVYAIADGTILVRRTATGYGGVVLIEFSAGGGTVTGVYGHVRLSSVTKQVGDTVKLGERIGVLGTGNSSETDGERKHLHFALLKGKSTTLAGYVQSTSALTAWYDPEVWLREHGAVEPG